MHHNKTRCGLKTYFFSLASIDLTFIYIKGFSLAKFTCKVSGELQQFALIIEIKQKRKDENKEEKTGNSDQFLAKILNETLKNVRNGTHEYLQV